MSEKKEKVSVGVKTPNTLGDEICVMCNESYSQEYFTFGQCDHKLCYRCFKLLNTLPNREPKCPICKQ